ncbi:hypothetical protein SAMN04488498_1613 [Mesorhizobium albiziae]|uniref:NACHT domain-containing protein n=1 Tax=Neomesorhizobium albiziae TaxID=335020 RepID=A0A1I4FUD4_9HYPH|nr:hypothetical protein SAMN04488498_1613 [Mesorhizobium albiziae]
MSPRELLGEIDQAVQHDPAMEAWFLAATTDVPEQVENQLLVKGSQLGVPVLVIDCKGDGDVWSLVALCTVDPDVVEVMANKEAAELARLLVPPAASSLERLRRECAAWQLGFDRLRASALDELNAIWRESRTAVAKLGQDAAGGSRRDFIPRTSVKDELDRWWNSAAPDAPAAVIGLDGVGKTWACLDWMISKSDLLPIPIVVPASALAGRALGNAVDVQRFLGEKLFEMTGARDANHWQLRLGRLLNRPGAEGPVLVLMLDGLNQDSSVP